MTQPTPYRRGYDFSDAGGATPPGGPLDGELDDIGLTVSQILRNLALIQRDDTALRNGIVGIDALDSRVLGLIAGGTFSIAGQWATATSYEAGAFFSADDVIYLAMEAHTSTTIIDDLESGVIATVFQNELGNRLRDDFTGDGVQTAFTLSQSPARPSDVEVYVDGLLVPTDDYAQTGSTVTFDVAPANGDEISIFSIIWTTTPPIQTLIDAVGDRNTEISAATQFIDDIGDSAPGKGSALVADDDGAGGTLWTTVRGFISRLRSSAGSLVIGFLQAGDDAVARNAQEKLREFVSVLDFGADPTGVADSTPAIHAAMMHLMDRFEGDADFYPGGPGDPTDFSGRDRRTGRIYFPAGIYKVVDEVFSSLIHPRSPYVGFEFFGEHRRTSVLMLETNGVESWFYNNGAGNERYQTLLFRSLEFRSDDYRYGNVAKIYSVGGPKQFRFEHCEFQNLNRFMWTQGIGNADLNKTMFCYGHWYGDFLTLDNDQSVQHDFIACDFGFYGNQIRVMEHGGGNVNFHNCSMDWIWHVDYSPVGGNFMFTHDSDANIGQGNCTFKWADCRIEVEAYKRTAGAAPFGLVNTTDNPNTAMPRIVFDNVNFVNGNTYTIDGAGEITGSDYRRITAVKLYPRKYVEFRNCVLLKTFFYEIAGDRDTGSPNAGGVLKFVNCFDGVVGELPAADSALENLHRRVTYSGTAGRVITEGMIEHTTGSSYIRKLIDADPYFRSSIGREPSTSKKICSFKHISNGFPLAANNTGDMFLDIPTNLLALRLFVLKPATGASTNAYQLHLKITDRSGSIIASSTLAQFKDAHVIDVSHVDLTGVSRICLCADGAGTDFQTGGLAYIEYC